MPVAVVQTDPNVPAATVLGTPAKVSVLPMKFVFPVNVNVGVVNVTGFTVAGNEAGTMS